MTNLLPGELGRPFKFGTSRSLDSLICRRTTPNQGAWRGVLPGTAKSRGRLWTVPDGVTCRSSLGNRVIWKSVNPLEQPLTERNEQRRLYEGGEESYHTFLTCRPFEGCQFGWSNQNWLGTALGHLQPIQQGQHLGGPTAPVEHANAGRHPLRERQEVLGRPTGTNEKPGARQFPLENWLEAGMTFENEQSGRDSRVRLQGEARVRGGALSLQGVVG